MIQVPAKLVIHNKRIPKAETNYITLLPLFVLLLFIIYSPEMASAQQSGKFRDISTAVDNHEQSIPWIGIDTTIDVTEDIANELGMKEPLGVLVMKVSPESPAQEAGILEGNYWTSIEGIDVKLGGDVILKVDNETITDTYSFETSLQDKLVGDNLKLTIFRDGQTKEINFTISSRPGPIYENSSAFANPENVNFSSYANLELGFKIEYPSSWGIEDYHTPNSVIFRSLPEYSVDNAQDYLRIDVVESSSLDSTISVDDFVHVYDPLQNLSFLELPHNITDSAAESVYTYSDSMRGEIKVLKRAIQNNDKFYVFNYFAQTSDFNDYLPTIKHMISESSFEAFNVLRYEMPGPHFSGIVLRYPDIYPWSINEIDDDSVNLMAESIFLKRDFILSVYPYNKSLSELEKDLRTEYHGRQDLHLENKENYPISITLDEDIPARKIVFSYYDNTIEDNVKGVRVYSVFDNKAFVVTFVSASFLHDLYRPTAEEIIDSLKIITPLMYDNSDFKPYEHGLISEIHYPQMWDLIPQPVGVGLQIFSNRENPSTDEFTERLFMSASAAGVMRIEDVVSHEINRIKNGNLTNFEIEASEQTTLLDNPAHKIIYTYNDNQYDDFGQYHNVSEDAFSEPCYCDVKEMMVFTIKDQKVYTLYFTAERDKFSSYLPTIEKILNSTKVDEKEVLENGTTISGLPLNGGPIDLAVNSVTNKLYVAIPEARQIQVIDGFTDQVTQNITIGGEPNAVTLNPYNNRIYVASPETDMIYVIDGLTNEVTAEIQAGPLVGDIAVDANEFGGVSSLVFVANQGNSSVSVIDDVKGRVISNVKTEGEAPYGVAIDSMKNRAYVTTNYGVEVIDYTTSLEERGVFAVRKNTINTDDLPIAIVVDSNRSRAYITNGFSNTVSVIDTASERELFNVTVGLFPQSIAFDPSNKKLYVSNTGNSSFSIVDVMTDKQEIVNSTVKEIPIDGISYDVAVNPYTNRVYLAHFETKTLSTVDGAANKLVSALTFRIDPPNAGRIECNGNEMPENSYQRIAVGTKCRAIANPGYAFSSWSDGSSFYNSTGISEGNNLIGAFSPMIASIFGGSVNKTHDTFTVSQYGLKTANFFSLSSIIQAASPYISVGGLLLVILLAAIKPSFHIRKTVNKESNKNKKNIQTESILPRNPFGDTIENDESQKQEGKHEVKVEETNLLSKGEILTIDATVIIGVLIFLTFSEGFDPSEQYQINVITASIVFPFAISAVIGITMREKLATRLMIAGFINLMVSIILIAIMRL